MIDFNHGQTDDGELFVCVDEYEQLQARVKELEDMVEDYREKVRSWASKALRENSEKCRLEAENAELRREHRKNRYTLSRAAYFLDNGQSPRSVVNYIRCRMSFTSALQQADDEGKA